MSFKDSDKVKKLIPNAENVAYVLKIFSATNAIVKVLQDYKITADELQDVLDAIPDMSEFRIHSL